MAGLQMLSGGKIPAFSATATDGGFNGTIKPNAGLSIVSGGGLLLTSDPAKGGLEQLQYLSRPTTSASNVSNSGTGTRSASTGSVSGSSATSQAAAQERLMANAIRDVAANRQSRLQSMIQQLDPRMKDAMAAQDRNYQYQQGRITSARDAGLRNLDVTAQQNDMSKERGFRDIASGIRNSIGAFRNQLGTMNAGDSSAADILAPYAFAKLQGQQRGDVLDTYNTNATNIDLARQNVNSAFSDQLNQLQFEKDNAVQQIRDQFFAIRQEINDRMASADEDARYQLANLGQEYTMQALANIEALDNDYRARADQIASQYSSFGQADISAYNPQVAQNVYSTYGRAYAPNIGGFSNPDEAVVAPATLRNRFV